MKPPKLKLITDFSAILKLEVDKYWREKLSIEDLIKLKSPGYNYKTFYKAVKSGFQRVEILNSWVDIILLQKI